MGEYSLMKKPTHVNPSDDSFDMAASIASRICHDLIGPIGAIVNGMELLQMVGGGAGPEQELISDSAESASARLQFFRIAFGAPSEQPIGQTDVRTLLEQIARDSRMPVTWHPEGPKSRSEVRMAFLALQCCEAALPRGGQAHVIEEDGAWTVTASGPQVSVEPDLWGWLDGAGDRDALIPAKVQFALLPQATAQLGRQLRADRDATGLTLRF